MPLCANRHRALAVCAITMWIGCITWSANAAIGFAASTRGETVAQRIADAKARTGWEATVERAERQIADLARHRPCGREGRVERGGRCGLCLATNQAMHRHNSRDESR